MPTRRNKKNEQADPAPEAVRAEVPRRPRATGVTDSEKQLTGVKSMHKVFADIYKEALTKVTEELKNSREYTIAVENASEEFWKAHAELMKWEDSLRELNVQLQNEVEIEEGAQRIGTMYRDSSSIENQIRNMTRKKTENDQASCVESVGGSHRKRLPKLELPKFSGEVRDWLAFWSQFEEIHKDPSIPTSDKFQYLIQTMTPGTFAQKIVLGYPVTSDNYKSAVDSLKEKFGRESVLVKVYVRDLLQLVIENTTNKQKMEFSSLYVQLSSQLRALCTLGVTTDKCASIIYPLVECCLPEDILRAWQRDPNFDNTDDSGAELEKLMEFLKKEVRSEDNIRLATGGLGGILDSQSDKGKGSSFKKSNISTAAGLLSTEANKKPPQCIFCDKSHMSKDCRNATKMTLEERQKIVKEKGRCFICLGRGHPAKACRSSTSCINCSGRHEVLMCQKLSKNRTTTSTTAENITVAVNDKKNETPSSSSSLANNTSQEVLLQTLVVKVYGNGNGSILARALIDTGSQKSYIKKELAKTLNLKPTGKERIIHGLFGGQKSAIQDHQLYKIYLSSLDDSYRCDFTISDIPNISDNINRVSSGPWIEELNTHGIKLSDMGNRASEVDLLIGADVAGKLLTGKKIELASGPVAMETRLGWTVMGKIKLSGMQTAGSSKMLSGMFNEGGSTPLSAMQFAGSSKKLSGMLSKEGSKMLSGMHSEVGSTKLSGMDCESSSTQFPNVYVGEVETRVSSLSLTHNAVTLLNSLHVWDAGVETLWTLDAIGIQDPADKYGKQEKEDKVIQQFNKTVRINEENRFEVELPWIDGKESLPDNRWIAERRLKTTTSRLVQDSTLESYDKLFKLWEELDMIEEVPKEEINNFGHYLPHRAVYNPSSTTTPIRPVFDASCKQKGGLSLNECLDKGPNFLELIPAIITRARLNQFMVLADIEKAFQQISVSQKDRDVVRFLWWKDMTLEKLKVYRHKRVVFGVNASPFLLAASLKYLLDNAPVEMKSIAEQLRKSLYVDNVVAAVSSMQEAEQFQEKSCELLSTVNFKLRGWEIGPSDVEKEVSLLGLKWNTKEDTISCAVDGIKEDSNEKLTRRNILSTANSVFDPIGFTVPFMVEIKTLLQDSWKLKVGWDTEMSEEIKQRYQKWTSQVAELSKLKVPRWITSLTGNREKWSLHIFVDASSHAYAAAAFLRVENDGKVSVHLVQAKTRVPPVKQNITIPRLELLSGMIGARLATSVKGYLDYENIPTYFWTDSSTALHWIQNHGNWGTFVKGRVAVILQNSKPEEWRHIPGAVNPADLPSRGCSAKQLIKSRWWEGPNWLLQDEEKWPKSAITFDQEEVNRERIKTVTAALSHSVEAKLYDELCKLDTYDAMLEHVKSTMQNKEEDPHIRLLLIVQRANFKGKDDKRLKKFVIEEECGIMRIKSKLLHGDFCDTFRMPIVLPDNCPVVHALIMKTHQENNHGGCQFLRSKLREEFWILNSRRVVPAVKKRCITCQRFDVKRLEAMPAALPRDRIHPELAFDVTGIDLCGPLVLKDRRKVWIVLFTCAVYRAVHLELVTSLSTSSFKSALRRFVNRRGKPKVIYSDNGTNFVGCSNEMKKIDWEKVQSSEAGSKITWKFIPPAAPWWGGWWERMVGLVKDCLRRVMGQAVLNQQELYTMLTDVESTVNQRPLTYVSEDPEDLIPLTPSMFLIGTKTSDIPDLDQVDLSGLNKRLRFMLRIREDLKSRFKKEYLGQLENLKKSKNFRQLEVGDVVLVELDNLKRAMWPIGRIVEVMPGEGGKIRRVKVKTSNGVIERAVQRIYPFEVPREAEKERFA